MSTGYLPKFNPGAAFTVLATTDITAGRLVTAAGAQSPADSPSVVGVSARTVVTGEHVTVYGGGVQELVAAEPIAIEDLVKAAADGEIAVYTPGTDAPETLLGVALAVGAVGATVPTKFLR
ncbi:DUF2190 family protein [Microbacterium betulae]|uniref:DUF2190 family protein n=1 Tax=Microbacterium betulae TaxID=2981139 RepID=A0AA97I6G6_9MICO|nr:capsid cement protein [Microbacterium sp. AB]WOF23834.1 DUF2190 family protein [Microbacterium sp. AB]